MNTNNLLKKKADTLFWVFEEYFFKNTGHYCRRTNLVLEFADFIDSATREELEQYVTFSSNKEFSALKNMINNGIDLWLDSADIKTLLLGA